MRHETFEGFVELAKEAMCGIEASITRGDDPQLALASGLWAMHVGYLMVTEEAGQLPKPMLLDRKRVKLFAHLAIENAIRRAGQLETPERIRQAFWCAFSPVTSPEMDN